MPPDKSRILADYIRAASERPFSFGADDCCTFVADALVAIGLPDPMADIRGKYGTARGLRDILPESLESTMAAIAARQGWSDLGPALAVNADVGVVRDAEGQHTAAIRFGWHWHAKAPHGVAVFDTSSVVRAWRPW